MPNGVIAIPLGGFVQQISVFGFFAVATIGVVAQTLWFFLPELSCPTVAPSGALTKHIPIFAVFLRFLDRY